MRKYILGVLISFMVLFSGCNYLDIVPDDRPTLNDAFKNEVTAEAFVYACYGYMPVANDFRTNFSWFTSNEIVNSYHWGSQWFSYARIQRIDYSPSDPVMDIWRNSYEGIRQAFIFLENIDRVVPVTVSQSEFEMKKKRWIAEVKFLIAYYHYILLQNYGPIVIVDNLMDINSTGDTFFKARSTYDECVEKVAEMFDAAIVDLPNTVAKGEYGHATKIAAQGFKSRMYLYAASPLFNGNSEYYSNFKNKDGTVLISQTYDKEKWKKAMEETKIAIDMAESAGFALYEYKGTVKDSFDKAVKSARYTMVEPWNQELIFGYSGRKEDADWGSSVQRHFIPRGWRTGTPVGGISANMVAVEMYHTENGLPIDKDPKYRYNDRMKIDAGDSTIYFHREREPRFYANIGYDRGSYEISGETKTLKLKFGETNGAVDLNVDHLYTGYAIKKGVHPETTVNSTQFSLVSYPFPLLRLGELYLNYAEAVANYSGSLDANGIKYFNAIRAKAGIPTLQEAYGNPTGDELVSIIQREKMIEFMFEAFWLPDLKRWKRAETFFDELDEEGGMWGLNSMGKTNEEFYKLTHLTGQNFRFERKSHLFPIKQTYVDVNHNLVQNPEW